MMRSIIFIWERKTEECPAVRFEMQAAEASVNVFPREGAVARVVVPPSSSKLERSARTFLQERIRTFSQERIPKPYSVRTE